MTGSFLRALISINRSGISPGGNIQRGFNMSGGAGG
jgi:hypothetical protein